MIQKQSMSLWITIQFVRKELTEHYRERQVTNNRPNGDGVIAFYKKTRETPAAPPVQKQMFFDVTSIICYSNQKVNNFFQENVGS